VDFDVRVRGTEPLNVARRIQRGFNRIGLLIGAIVAIGGAIICFSVTNSEIQAVGLKRTQAECLQRSLNAGTAKRPQYGPEWAIDPSSSGCASWPLYHPSAADVATVLASKPNYQDATNTAFYGALITAASAAACYFILSLLGWIIAGFTREPDRF
jgi:hypothetical protein